ncbi:hypothetical protein GCM10022198_22380 [Klugiella xanthotipulae]|nr:hypothetical protein [Klugiella xanthotipulae]
MAEEQAGGGEHSSSGGEGSEVVIDGSYWHLSRMVIVWVVAALASAAVSVWVSDGLRFEWLLFVLAGATLLTFGLQLGTAQKRGFIDRTALSVAGAFIVVALFSALGPLVA